MKCIHLKSILIVFFLLPVISFAQDGNRYALVIGNGAYTGLSRLNNPVNDANDMATALASLGFTVEKLINVSLPEMESAVVRLGNRLSQSRNGYGFFYYAGHGVQSNGINYLIPTDSDIPSESFLKTKSLPAQAVLDTLQQAGNELNIVVLDACRDNPFSWARSGTRGLSVMGTQPPGSIIVYATSAGSVAQDGNGRNGLFTSQLLKNIKTLGIDISDVFKKTGADVMTASGNRQVPAIYSQFFGTAHLNPTNSTILSDDNNTIADERQPIIYREDFDINVFNTTSWRKSDNSIRIQNGELLIGKDNSYDDFADYITSYPLPLIIESRMKLVNGGYNYRTPCLSIHYGSGTNDNIVIVYLSNKTTEHGGWAFKGWTFSDTKSLPSEDFWVTVKTIIKDDGGELFAKFDNDENYQLITKKRKESNVEKISLYWVPFCLVLPGFSSHAHTRLVNHKKSGDKQTTEFNNIR